MQRPAGGPYGLGDVAASSLAVSGCRLLSGSNDRTVRVWGMEGGGVELAVRVDSDSGRARIGCLVLGGVGGQGGVRVS